MIKTNTSSKKNNNDINFFFLRILYVINLHPFFLKELIWILWVYLLNSMYYIKLNECYRFVFA